MLALRNIELRAGCIGEVWARLHNAVLGVPGFGGTRGKYFQGFFLRIGRLKDVLKEFF